MKLQQFDYQLPPELIAQTPAEPRDASRLMVVRRQTGEISHHVFSDVLDFFDSGDILIANDSRVIPARLFGRKSTGGKVEILLLKPLDDLRWEALVGGKRLTPGTPVTIDPSPQSPISLTIEADLGEARRLIKFNRPIESELDAVGHVPLPP